MIIVKYDRYLLSVASFIVKHWLFLVNLAVFIFIVPILLYPYFMYTGNPTLVTIAGFIHAAYHVTCHQLPERSLFIFGYEMAVCARCFAIYVAFLAGGIMFAFMRKWLKPWDIKYYILLCVPMAIDGFTQLFGVAIPRAIGPNWQLIWMVESTNELRLITGAIFGLASALFVYPYIQAIFDSEDIRHEPGVAQSAGKEQQG